MLELERELGKFVRWGEQVTVDVVNRVLKLIPESRLEVLIEIPNEDVPAEDALRARCSSY
jgi:hypothetical protein